jgi:hypothetical protein
MSDSSSIDYKVVPSYCSCREIIAFDRIFYESHKIDITGLEEIQV